MDLGIQEFRNLGIARHEAPCRPYELSILYDCFASLAMTMRIFYNGVLGSVKFLQSDTRTTAHLRWPEKTWSKPKSGALMGIAKTHT